MWAEMTGMLGSARFLLPVHGHDVHKHRVPLDPGSVEFSKTQSKFS